MARIISGRGPLPPPVPPPPQPQPTPEPVVDGFAFPAGKVKSTRPNSAAAYDVAWANASRWEPWFSEAQELSGVEIDLLIAMAIVESDANQYTTHKTTGTRAQVIEVHDRFGGGPSVGIMQVKPQLWQSTSPQHDAYDPRGNIILGALLMKQFIQEVGSWERAIREKYHPGTSSAGTTPQDYVDTITSLRIELNPKPIIEPRPIREPLDVIFGGVKVRNVFDFLAVGGVGYPYGVGHGTTNQNQHTGVDVSAPFGTPFSAPAAGKVICVGERGQGMWDQACGFFRDTGMGGPDARSVGVGNITVMLDSGHKVVFGHSRTCNFRPGDRVQAGQQLGTTGGMLSPHMHLEVAIEKNGSYWLVHPLPALRIAMGQREEQPTPTVVEPITGIVWEGTSNFHDRRGQQPVALVYHITDDLNYANVKSWFQKPGSQASAHFVITRDGGPHQFVGSAKASWTNGVIKRPRTDIMWLNEAIRRCNAGLANMNDYTINLEFLADRRSGITLPQIEKGIQITRYYHAIYPGIRKNRGHHLRHADIDSVNRPYCPGPEFPFVEILEGSGVDHRALNP